MTRIRVGLALSILLNIFLVCAIGAGAVWMNYGQRMILAGSLRVAGNELPAEQRQAFRAAVRHARATVSDQIRDARNARVQASELLLQPTLDEAAVTAALDKARQAEFAVRAAIEKQALAFAAALPPEDRVKLADAISERIRRAGENRR